MHKGFCRLLLELYAELYFLITAKFIDFVADVILKALHVFLVCAKVEDGQQVHAMPRRDDKNVVIRRDMPELSALLNGTFHRSVNAAGGLGELEGGGAHN